MPTEALHAIDSPSDATLAKIAAALGDEVTVPYAPPNIYPMAAPAFVATPMAERRRTGDGLLGVYVHVPFCNYACTFCFYARRVGDEDATHERYVTALERELEWIEPGTQVASLYAGGGTPTALSAERLDRVLGTVFGRMRRDREGVHTVETTPESATPDRLDVLLGHRIGRVSMGVQTLNEDVLGRVRRAHDALEPLRAAERLLARGFRVNVDLIYGLPGQTHADYRRDFAAFADLGVHSVTAYSLRVNERTPVTLELPAADRFDLARLARWRDFVERVAVERGYRRIRWHTFVRGETSGAASESAAGEVPGIAGDQFGAGASARSRFGGTIFRNHASLSEYLARIADGRSPVEETLVLDEEDERIRMVARTLGEGRPLVREAYETRFQRSFDDDYRDVVGRLAAADLVVDDGSAIALTPTGGLVYDLVLLCFYPRRVRDWLRERQRGAFRRVGLTA